MAQDIPVYLFTGFMDSGKTTLVEETLFENNFGDGSKRKRILRLQNCRKSRTPISRNKFLSSTTAPGGWTSCLRQKCRRAG